MVFRKLLQNLTGSSQKLQQFKQELEKALQDGILTPEEERYLNHLKMELGLKDEDIKQISKTIFKEELEKALDDEKLTFEEQLKLEQLKSELNLSDDELKKELETISEYILLRELQEGKLPQIPSNMIPNYLLVAPDEICHCIVKSELYEGRIVRERGTYQGFSIRITRGLYYRTGTYTEPKVSERIQKTDEGTLAVTNKRFIFIGVNRTIDIPLENIYAVEFFKDAITLHRKGKKRKEFFVVERPKLIGGIIHAATRRALEIRQTRRRTRPPTRQKTL